MQFTLSKAKGELYKRGTFTSVELKRINLSSLYSFVSRLVLEPHALYY